jgi:hypothetical protein
LKLGLVCLSQFVLFKRESIDEFLLVQHGPQFISITAIVLSKSSFGISHAHL